jgi:hypothetical protein
VAPDDLFGVGPHPFPRRRELDASTAAGEECDAQLPFQFLDVTAHRRLAEVELGGGMGEAAAAGEEQEGLELVKVQGRLDLYQIRL